MTLVEDWRAVLTRAWSVRLIAINLILSAAAGMIADSAPSLILRWGPWAAYLVAGLSGAALVARLLSQANLAAVTANLVSDESGSLRMPRSRAGKAGIVVVPAAVLAIGLPFTQYWEGTKLVPYKDIIGRWTVCTGETNVPMRAYTAAECSDMFTASWQVYYQAMLACFPTLAEAPASVQAMATDLGYNNGVAAVCASRTTGGHIKARRWAEFCESLTAWVSAGGKKSQGLMNRRYAGKYNSHDVCLAGIPT